MRPLRWEDLGRAQVAVWNIVGFLDDDPYDEFVRSNPEPPSCVLDIVELWLATDDNILEFDSFETFLIGLVTLADDWARGDRRAVGEVPLWRDPETGEPRVIQHFSERQHPDADRAGVHPLLNRANFEYARAVALARQQKEQTELLRQLTAQSGQPDAN